MKNTLLLGQKMEPLVPLFESTWVNYYGNLHGPRTMDAIKSHDRAYTPKEGWKAFDWHWVMMEYQHASNKDKERTRQLKKDPGVVLLDVAIWVR